MRDKMIKSSIGIKGKRKQERLDAGSVDEEFVVNFPLSLFQRKAIETIYQMRVATTSQIQKITGYSYDYICNQLLKLHLNRFLIRKFPNKNIGQPGSCEGYFMLDTAGAIYISGIMDVPVKDVKWSIRDNLIAYEKLNHALKITELRSALEKEIREKKTEDLKFLECWSDRHLAIKFSYEEKPYYLRPDIFISIEKAGAQYSFLAEVDRGTMAMSRFSSKTNAFEDKVPVYEYLKLSEAFKDISDIFPKILVFTTTADRAQKLMNVVRKKQKTKAEFLFTSFDFFEENPLGKIFIKTDGSVTNLIETR